MRVRVIRCFTDRTLVGRQGSSRRVGAEFECDGARAAELAEKGLVEVLGEPEAPKTKKAAKAKKTK